MFKPIQYKTEKEIMEELIEISKRESTQDFRLNTYTLVMNDIKDNKLRRQIRHDLENDPFMEAKERYVTDGINLRESITFILRNALSFDIFRNIQCPANEIYIRNNKTVTNEMVEFVFEAYNKFILGRKYR